MTFRNRLPLLLCTFPLCASLASAQQVIVATSGPVNPSLLTVDPSNGNILTSTPISNEEALFGGVTVDGTNLYSIDGYNDGNSDRTFRIDSTTGAGTIVGNTTFNWNFRCVENHPTTGVLYATTDNNLYTIDKSTGVATSIAPITAAGFTLDQFTAFAINSSGQAFGTDIGDTGLYSLDLNTGVATHIGDLTPGGSFIFQDLAFDSSGQLWGVGISGGVYTIDTTAATSTFMFASGAWGGLAFAGCDAPSTYCTVGTTSSNCHPAMSFAGTPSSTASSGFTVSCPNVDAQRSGIFFYGVANPSFVPTPWGAGGTSFKCVANPVQRMGLMNSGGTTGCTGSFSQDWNAYMASHPTSIGNPRTVGSSFEIQLWMRDPPSPKSTILSDGLRFTLCQ